MLGAVRWVRCRVYGQPLHYIGCRGYYQQYHAYARLFGRMHSPFLNSFSFSTTSLRVRAISILYVTPDFSSSCVVLKQRRAILIEALSAMRSTHWIREKCNDYSSWGHAGRQAGRHVGNFTFPSEARKEVDHLLFNIFFFFWGIFTHRLKLALGRLWSNVVSAV